MFGGLLRARPAKEGEHLGAHTQGCSIDELQENLKEVLTLCLKKFEGSSRPALAPVYDMYF